MLQKAIYANTFAQSVDTQESYGKPLTENQLISKKLTAAADAINTCNCVLARSLLKEAACIDIENPEVFNLLGVSYEREGDRMKASRFYRVAYYMDQSFSAPSDNLNRLCNFKYKGFTDVKWGLELIGGEIK